MGELSTTRPETRSRGCGQRDAPLDEYAGTLLVCLLLCELVDALM
jgi:hypothetical protein